MMLPETHCQSFTECTVESRILSSCTCRKGQDLRVIPTALHTLFLWVIRHSPCFYSLDKVEFPALLSVEGLP